VAHNFSKIVGGRMVARSTVITEYPQILCTSIQNLVVAWPGTWDLCSL